MKKKTKLVCGWGINDVDYPVQITNIINGKRKHVWTCPYYEDWKSMLQRCFDKNFQNKNPTYIGCKVCEEWKYFSNFIRWVDEQPNRDWVKSSLDKDFLVFGNKEYSHSSVIYIPFGLNKFLNEYSKGRGDLLLGVSPAPSGRNPYKAQCGNPFSCKGEYLGIFPTELDAHLAWQAKKHEHALRLADLQDDPRVADALRKRYAPDKDWSQL